MRIKESLPKSRFNVDYVSTNHGLEKAHPTDAGFDIKANVTSEVVLEPGEFKLIDTGIRLDLPQGIEAQVRPRSGMAAKHGVTILNAPGTIDPGYRGEVKVILINHGKEQYVVRNGDRIAQLVFSMVLDVTLMKVNEINTQKTDRKEKGLGSTEKREKK